MLSPGQGYREVPKGTLDNLDFRSYISRRCRASGKFRRKIVEACRTDILFWVNVFVCQYNPNAEEGREAGPFITWDFQDKMLRYGGDGTYGILQCVEDRKDLLIEKSREMGASWLFLILADWMARFHRHKQFLMISRSAEAVDSESPNSLFWKIDYLQRYIPNWLNGEVVRRKMSFAYNDSGSMITGEASTGRAGVGGRATAIFLDEFAQIKEDYEVYGRTSDTTRCRIFNSTHLGVGTMFFDLSQNPAIRKLKVHWTQHPEKRKGLYRTDPDTKKTVILDKDYVYPQGFEFAEVLQPTGGPFPCVRSPWYDEQCRRKPDSRSVAMDLDIDPAGSVAQFFDALAIFNLKREFCLPPYWVGDIHYERDSGTPLGLLPGPGGPLKLWMSPRADGTGNAVAESFYVLGADISTGCGTTNSAISIVDAVTGERVGEYVTPFIDAKELGTIAVALCRMFKDHEGNGARIAWEIPGPGQAFGQQMVDLGYRNIYYKTDNSLKRKVSDLPGWNQTPINKRQLLMAYKSALHERTFLNRSVDALEECLSFMYSKTGTGIEHTREGSGDDPTGARQNHGDRVIADALACLLMRELGLSRKDSVQEERKIGTLLWRRELHEAASRAGDDW